MQRNSDDISCNGHFNSGDESLAAVEHGRHPVAGYEARIAALERKIDQLAMGLDMVKKTFTIASIRTGYSRRIAIRGLNALQPRRSL